MPASAGALTRRGALLLYSAVLTSVRGDRFDSTGRERASGAVLHRVPVQLRAGNRRLHIYPAYGSRGPRRLRRVQGTAHQLKHRRQSSAQSFSQKNPNKNGFGLCVMLVDHPIVVVPKPSFLSVLHCRSHGVNMATPQDRKEMMAVAFAGCLLSFLLPGVSDFAYDLRGSRCGSLLSEPSGERSTSAE